MLAKLVEMRTNTSKTTSEVNKVRMQILKDDLTVKIIGEPLQRQPIGFVTTGDYSQARGYCMGIGLLGTPEKVQNLKEVNMEVKMGNKKHSEGLIALFRSPNSSNYHPCWLQKQTNIL